MGEENLYDSVDEFIVKEILNLMKWVLFESYELSDLDLDEENLFGRINCIFLGRVGDLLDGLFREMNNKESEKGKLI